MQFSRYVVYAGVAGVVGGLVMAVASLFALIVRLLVKFKD
jgi:hypothetical protein